MFGKKIKTQNTRNHKRLKASYLIKYQAAGTQEEPAVSKIKDLSAAGVRFVSLQFIPEGTLLKISFCVPALDRIFGALARITRARRTDRKEGYYLAAHFLEISPEQRDILSAFIEKLANTPGLEKNVDHRAVVKRNKVLNKQG